MSRSAGRATVGLVSSEPLRPVMAGIGIRYLEMARHLGRNGRVVLVHPGALAETPDAGPGGALAPATAQVVHDGASVAFTVTPDANHLVDTVEGCGGTLEDATYTTAAVFADCTVSARFVPDGTPTWVVTPLAGRASRAGRSG